MYHKKTNFRTYYILILLGLLFLKSSGLSAQKAYAPYLFEGSNKQEMEAWVNKTYNSLSTSERLAQMIMPIVYPSKDSKKIALHKERVKNYNWGGILYQKGLLAEQIRMNNQLQAASKIPMLIALDGEWGLYMRLKDAPRFPRNLGLGLQKDKQLIYNYGREVARQCRLMGIHINFAPDVDVNINPRNPVIGTRSFGEDPETVSEYALAYAEGLEDGGVLSVAKHFPGHGDTSQDSHKTLPTVSASKERIERVELAPFRAYINRGLGGIMTAHLKVPAYEKENIPSSLSYNICTELLQDKMNFHGLIFTDGLEMQGVLANGAKGIGVKAILAGNDMLLGPRDPMQTLQSLKKAYQNGSLPQKLVEEKVKKILRYKWRLIVSQDDLRASESAIKRAIWTEEAKELQKELWQKSLHFLKEDRSLWQKLETGKIKNIAVIKAGKRYVRSAYAPSTALGKARISYLSWNKLGKNKLKALAKYDLILLNIFSKNAVSTNTINLLARHHKLIVSYYHSPFQLNKARLKQSKANTIILAIQGTREAQAEVLRLLTREQQQIEENTDVKKAVDDNDPTANMSQDNSDAYIKEEKAQPAEAFSNPKNNKHFAELDELVQDGLDRGAFPSCQLFVARKGKLLYSKAYGTYTGTKGDKQIDRNSIFDLASVTKALATTPALMILVDRKKVNINNRLSTYLPKFRGTEVGNVRLKELLFHESGLPPGLPFYMGLFEPNSPISYWLKLLRDWDGRMKTSIYDSKYISSTFTDKCTKSFARNIYIDPNFKEVMLKAIANTKLKRRGEYRYSDLSFVLLQQVIEQVSGESLDTFLQKNLYEPIGAKVYFNPLEKSIPLNRIVPAQNDTLLRKQIIRGTVDDETAACLGGVSGNAGLFASAEELSKVCQLLLNKGRWGNKQIISRRVVNRFCKTKSKKSQRALGFDAPRPKVHNTAESASPNSIGHLGFTGTAFWIDRDRQLIYIFLSNRTYPHRSNKLLQRENYRPRLLQMVYELLNIA